MGAIFEHFGIQLVGIAIPPLATAIAALLVGILVKKLKSLGIEVDAQEQARLKTLTADTIRAVDEQANRSPMSPEQKDNLATAMLQAQAPHLDPADVRHAIDSTLPQVRADAAVVKLVTPLKPSTPATFGH